MTVFSNSCRSVLFTGLLFLLLPFHIQNAEAARPERPRVVTSVAMQGNILNEIRLTGTVSSPQVSRLSTEVNGIVKQIHVEEGSHVKAGQELLTLDQEIEKLSLQAARASTLRAVEELSDARRRLEDGERLSRKKTLSENELKSLQAEVKIASATLQRYRAEQQLQEIRLKRHQLLAPFSGIISRKFIEAGEWIKPGDPAFELVANERLRIDFQVPQREFPRIDTSSSINITLDALPDQTIAGKIMTIVPFSDSDSRTFLLRVLIDDSHNAIAPGMSASGILQMNTDSSSIIVPRDAIIRYSDGRTVVWVVDKDGEKSVAHEKQVQTGAGFANQVSILDGLQTGDHVIVEGNETLRDGQEVILHNP